MSSRTKTTATQYEARAGRVPKLRFPEFREAEGWDADSLGDVADFLNEKIPLERVALENYVSTENILSNYGGVARASKLPTTGSVTGFRPNDTLVSNIRPYLKKVWVADKEGGASNDVIVIRAKQRLLPQYFSCLLKNDAFIDYVMTSAKGVKMPRGDIASMKAYPALYPSNPEQQKIAECLSSVDELMAAQTRKVDALKTHKKGLMQQLFPREGETQPRLRFPEFLDAGEWEERTLGDYFDPIRNGFVGTATPYYTTSEGVRYLQGRNIKQGKIEADSIIYITDDFHNRQRKSHLKSGDILMVQSGHVGECAVVGPDFAGANCHALVILTPKRKLSSEFFAHYFYSPIGEFAIFQITTGNTIKHILASELKTLPVLIPDLAEQQRIASCLSSLDALITAETQKLEALKTHKKGLMQELFPSPKEAEA